jgi:uncharacterized protein YkwD
MILAGGAGLMRPPSEGRMIRSCGVCAVAALLGIVALPLDADAAPPTVTPSPGYDARLEEQHKAAAPTAPESLASPPKASAPHAVDYAGAISAYRKAHGLPAVKSDAKLAAAALKQAQAMAASGSVSHSAGGSFSTRVASLRKHLAAENIGAGYLTFPEMLKQWEDSRGHRENLLMVGARHVGVASVANPASPYRKFWAMVITD